MTLYPSKYNEFSSILEKFCLDLGMTILDKGLFKYFCYDANNPIWVKEFCTCPSAILAVNETGEIWLYPELMQGPNDKILLTRDNESTDDSDCDINTCKKIIKKTIQKYKNFLVSKKFDNINKDFQ